MGIGIGVINVFYQFWDQSVNFLENMQKSYILFDVTWRKNGTSYIMGAGYFR